MRRGAAITINTILIAIISFANISQFNALNVKAVNIQTVEDINLDSSIIREDINYNLPTRVLITPIYIPDDTGNINAEEWYRGLYYYTVSKLGFNDIPFHYVIADTGETFKGNSGGDERKISVSDYGSDMVVVGYLSEKHETNFNPRSEQELVDLLTEICNKNEINPKNIEIEAIRFVRNQSTKSVSIVKDDLIGQWRSNLENLKAQVNARYQPVKKEYKVEVLEVVSPSEAVEPGSEATVSIKVSNLSQYGIYGGSGSELLLTKADQSGSIFYLNNVWASQSQLPVLELDQTLLPLSEGTFEVRVRAPLYTGEVSETFEVWNFNGEKVSDQPVVIKLNLSSTNRSIGEIIQNQFGVLNVRSNPNIESSVIAQASPGERYFIIDYTDNGWVQIELHNGQKGWLAQWYVRQVN